MCLAVYLASNKPIPLVEWNDAAPRFNVVPITDDELLVKKQFRNQNVVYAGSHQGCGCGFFKEGASGEELLLVQANYDSFVRYLGELMSDGANIEIFCCWEGDQGSEPEFKERLSLAALGSESFEFKEKAYYEIV